MRGVHQSSGSSSSRSSSSAASSDYWDESDSANDRRSRRLSAPEGSSSHGSFRRTSTATSATSASSSDDDDEANDGRPGGGEAKSQQQRAAARLTAAPPSSSSAVGSFRQLEPAPAPSDPRSSKASPRTAVAGVQQQRPTAGRSKAAGPACAPSPAAAADDDDFELGLLGDEVAWEDEILRSTSPDRPRVAVRADQTTSSTAGPSSSVVSSSRPDRPGPLLPLHTVHLPSSSDRWRAPSPDDLWCATSRPRSLLESLRRAIVRPGPMPFEGTLACSLLPEASLPLLAPSLPPSRLQDDERPSTTPRQRSSSQPASPTSSNSSPTTQSKLLRSATLILLPALAYFALSVLGLGLAGNLFFIFGRFLGFYTLAYRVCFWAMVAVAAGCFYYCGVSPSSLFSLLRRSGR